MKRHFLLAIGFVISSTLGVPAQDGIPISVLKRDEPVDFDREVLPLLRQNCLACHNASDAEGDVVLESVESIVKSEAVVAGKPDESSLLTLSAHLDDPVMPPEDNEVKAKNMTPDQLGLIKLWIAQGAKPSAAGGAAKVEFAALPPGVNPVYALAMSADGQFLAAGRANQIFVYRVPGKRLVDRVTDPDLVKSSPYNRPGIAHLDIVQSLAFAPDNETFVSGGFRNVKIWKKQPAARESDPLEIAEAVQSLGRSNHNRWLAFGGNGGSVFLWDPTTRKPGATIKTGDQPIDALAVTEDATRMAVVTGKKNVQVVDVNSGKPIGPVVALEQDAQALAFANSNQQLLVTLADHSVAIYSLEKWLAATEEPLKPENVLKGHSQGIKRLQPYGERDEKLLTAADDGTARIWNLENGQNIRSFSHGGALAGAEVSADETRVATVGLNGSLKIFDATNGSLVKEVRGDADTAYQIATLDRDVRLRQQLIDVAKNDVETAKKEKTAEEENVKKTEETLKKADEELKQKTAAKMKADDDHQKANQNLEQKKSEMATVEKAVQQLDSQLQTATAKLKALTDETAKLDAQLKKLEPELATLKKNFETAQNSLTQDPENGELKKAATEAGQQVADKEKVQQEWTAERTRIEAEAKELDQVIKKMTAEKQEQDKKLAALKAEVGKLEPEVKKLADAKKKADDEHEVAVRNQMLAKNSVERAQERTRKVAETIPVLEQQQQAAEAAKTNAEKAAADFKTQRGQQLNALVGLAKLNDTTLAYQDAAGNLGTCDFKTGETLDFVAFPESANNQVLLGAQGQLLSVANDWKQIHLLSWNPGWTLARTIGAVDDPSSFVDRVTALDISADGKWLATGSGEPSRSGEIKIWNLADGSLVREIQDAHSDTILDIRFSPDARQLASASSDRFMKTFDVATGKMIRVFEGHTHHVMSVDWNSTGRTLSTAGADQVVKVWDAETGTQNRTISGYGKEVTALSFIELSNEIVTACGDRSVSIKRTDNGGQVRNLAGNTDFVYAVAVSADGKRIAAAGEDSIVRVWNEAGQLQAEFAPPAEETSKVSAK